MTEIFVWSLKCVKSKPVQADSTWKLNKWKKLGIRKRTCPHSVLFPTLSGAHANHDPASLAEDVFFTLADGQGGGRLEGDLFIPTAQTRYEIIATFPSSAHYEETTRTVIVEVGDGQKDLSKREEFALRIIDIAGTRDPIFVPKATSVPISATLSFGAQRAFELGRVS